MSELVITDEELMALETRTMGLAELARALVNHARLDANTHNRLVAIGEAVPRFCGALRTARAELEGLRAFLADRVKDHDFQRERGNRALAEATELRTQRDHWIDVADDRLRERVRDQGEIERLRKSLACCHCG